MPITSIQRDQNNNVSLVRMISTDSLATIDGTDYIAQQQETINALNGGTWQWFITDMILVAADDGNAFFEFIDDTFTSLTIFGSIGSGIINPGMTNQLPYYSTNGRVLSPLTNMADAILATNGSQVPGLTQTLPTAVQTNITALGTIATGVWNGTGIIVPFGGTGKASFTAYAVVCGGTTSTGALQSVASVGTAGHILTSNGPGLLPTFQVSPGSGTVSPGLQNELAYYAANGTTVSGLTSIASGVLVTSGLGVPSISQTLPAAVQGNITALGTIATGVWNGTVISGQFGGTGVNNGSSTITIGGNVTFSGAFTFAATLTGNTAVTFPTSGTLATTSQLPTPSALTRTDDTNVTLTLGGSPTVALLAATSLTLGWTGTLSGTRGGTGVNNGSNTATFAGNLNFAAAFTTSGAFAVTQTYTGVTNVTFPTSGTLATTSQIPTGAALTKTDDTNVTLTLGGSPTTALVNAASLTLGWTGQLGLTRGGTNASLTASNGGIVYSTATALAILAGTATANQVLLSGSSTTPAWSTATYPATTTINQLLYSSSNNTIVGLATVNSQILTTSSGGVPTWSTTLPAFTTSAITFSPTTGGIVGTTTNDNAAAGKVGEYISAGVLQGSAVGLTTGTPANVTSISLTAGDWDVCGSIITNPADGTLTQFVGGGISTTSATMPTGGAENNQVQTYVNSLVGQQYAFTFGQARLSLSATTTVYLIGYVLFTTSTLSAYGFIGARRVR